MLIRERRNLADGPLGAAPSVDWLISGGGLGAAEAEDRHDCFWLYVVTNCHDQPVMQEPIADPARFPWHEVVKVAHYWLEVNTMTKPMQVREDKAPYSAS